MSFLRWMKHYKSELSTIVYIQEYNMVGDIMRMNMQIKTNWGSGNVDMQKKRSYFIGVWQTIKYRGLGVAGNEKSWWMKYKRQDNTKDKKLQDNSCMIKMTIEEIQGKVDKR